jgi:hypothetical protein
VTVAEDAPIVGGHQRVAGSPRFGFFRRRLREWTVLGQYGFPFSLDRDSSPIGRYRTLARRARFPGRGRLVRALTTIVMTLAWPMGALSTALRTFARMRGDGHAANSVRVLLDMYWLALRHSIPPVEYALYRFDNAERRKNMRKYVYWNDLPGLAAMNARLGANNRDVQDKDCFAQICASNGFSHVPTIAVFDRGRQIHPEAAFVPNTSSFWIKSLRLKGGAGGAKWIKEGEAYRNMTGRRVPATQLVGEFCNQNCLVQPFIENHPDIARITNGALASLRIVSGMDGRGKAEFVTALIALPHGARETSVAGILCGIEYETGRIRRATLPDGEAVECHPDTGSPIVGVVLPCWRESIDLVLRAHAIAFSRFAFLGWDVAVTKEGPLLLETNSGWGALFHQMLDGPLGHTSFSHLVSHYV